MSRNKLYILIVFACVAGYAWIIMLHYIKVYHAQGPDACLFKCVTNIPCPSCGSSRSVMAIFHGDIQEAVYLNPLGFLIFIIMLITPFWITGDLLWKRSSLFHFYQYIEFRLKQRRFAVPAVLLVLLNWIWNIKKYI